MSLVLQGNQISQVVQMDSTDVYDVFVMPLMFKTISFHHRANYNIKIKFQHGEVGKAVAIRPASFGRCTIVNERTGNIAGIGVSSVGKGMLQTDRFPIDYNQQSIKFTTGMWATVTTNALQPLAITIELYRIDIDLIKGGVVSRAEDPPQEKVSSQTLFLNLQSNHQQETSPYSFRKLVFPTNQYISFVDVMVLSAKIGKHINFKDFSYDGEMAVQSRSWINCCMTRREIADPEGYLREVYQLAILDKLKCYSTAASLLKQLIKVYHHRVRTQIHTIKTGKRFEKVWVRREIPNLSYLVVEGQQIDSGVLQSCMPIYSYQSRDLGWNLCYHYYCEINQVSEFMGEESYLIENNTRALFMRCIQVAAALADGETVKVVLNEMQRVRQFITLGLAGQQHPPQVPYPLKLFTTYKNSIQRELKLMTNYCISEEKQPLLMVSGQSPVGRPIDIAHTVTILVHGFRGSEFDLSKMKSYLNLFLGFTNFYAVKSLMQGDGTNASISKLGELAGQEVNKYIEHHPAVKYVNMIGFSMGGVIARSMLKHIHSHREKFNLLLTLASPHLGIRQIQSCIVRVGLFYMRRVAKVQSIQDLNNERTADSTRFIQELATCSYINYFKWVILVGSHEDQYVPVYSSLCNYRGDNEQIKGLCETFNQQRGVTIRCTARFEVDQSLMDKLTRRRVHISLLENDSFIKMLILKFSHYFTHSR